MKAGTITSLRAKMKYYFDLVSNDMDVIKVPMNNSYGDEVVIMSIREYNAHKETEYLMSSRSNRKSIEESIQQIGKNEMVKFEE